MEKLELLLKSLPNVKLYDTESKMDMSLLDIEKMLVCQKEKKKDNDRCKYIQMNGKRCKKLKESCNHPIQLLTIPEVVLVDEEDFFESHL